MAFVLDGSMTLAWCFADERTDVANAVIRRMANDVAHVPAIWSLEVVNGLMIGQRRGLLAEAEIASFLEEIQPFDFIVDDASRTLVFNVHP